jgi:hypothetical protein
MATPPGELSRAERNRQSRTGDKYFYRADLPYLFELRIKNESGFFPLILKPEALDIKTQFTVAPTATLDGGLYVEENGAVMRTLSIRGTTGWTPTYSPAKADYAFKPTVKPQFNSLATRRFAPSSIVYERMSGHQHFQALNDLVFERYSDYKRDPVAAPHCSLIFHMPKESDSWVVAPLSFDLQRNASAPLSYFYNIELLMLEPWSTRQDPAPFEVRSTVKAASKTLTAPPRSLLQRITAGLQDLRRLISAGQAIYRRIQAIIQDVINVVNEVARFIGETINNVATVVRAVGSVIRGIQEALIALYTLPEQAVANVRAALMALEDDVLVFARFIDRSSRVNSRIQSRNAAPSSAVLTAAGQRAITANSTGTISAQAPTAQRQFPTITSTRQHALSATDTLETLALRYTGDTRNWQLIAQLNGLRAPYISTAGLPYTVRPGAFILVPSPEAVVPEIATILDNDITGDVRGTDLQLQKDRQSGLYDIIINSNDIETISGNANLVQALGVRLDTEAGTSLLSSGYGFRISVGSNIDFVQARIGELALREALQADPRVLSVDQVTVQDSPADSFIATATVSVYAQTEALSLTAATRYPNA